jgi:hypothetical protein
MTFVYQNEFIFIETESKSHNDIEISQFLRGFRVCPRSFVLGWSPRDASLTLCVVVVAAD